MHERMNVHHLLIVLQGGVQCKVSWHVVFVVDGWTCFFQKNHDHCIRLWRIEGQIFPLPRMFQIHRRRNEKIVVQLPIQYPERWNFENHPHFHWQRLPFEFLQVPFVLRWVLHQKVFYESFVSRVVLLTIPSLPFRNETKHHHHHCNCYSYGENHVLVHRAYGSLVVDLRYNLLFLHDYVDCDSGLFHNDHPIQDGVDYFVPHFLVWGVVLLYLCLYLYPYHYFFSRIHHVGDHYYHHHDILRENHHVQVPIHLYLNHNIYQDDRSLHDQVHVHTHWNNHNHHLFLLSHPFRYIHPYQVHNHDLCPNYPLHRSNWR
mmetsp:Transcript_1642/g.2339  ORF Transcript_1642/g.2339 Transcript_1642/m.2339 type:complete len:316 (-) Transcript_1642:455-1402(-)